MASPVRYAVPVVIYRVVYSQSRLVPVVRLARKPVFSCPYVSCGAPRLSVAFSVAVTGTDQRLQLYLLVQMVKVDRRLQQLLA